MFPQTDSFQNSSRHQSEPLEPCGVRNLKDGPYDINITSIKRFRWEAEYFARDRNWI